MNAERDRRLRRRVSGIAALGFVGVLAVGCSEEGTSSAAAEDFVALAPAGSFDGNAATGDSVRVGLIVNEGGQAISQPETREAAEAAASYANDHLGGIGGRPIELVICKSHEDPASALDCANRMVESNVQAVVVTSTGFGATIVPVISGAGIPYVSAAGGSIEEMSDPNTFMWTGGFPGALQAMAAYSGQAGYEKVSAFLIDVPTSINGFAALGAPAFAAAGVEARAVPIPAGTPDAAPQVGAGLSDDPEGVIVIGEPTVCTSVLRGLATMGTEAERMVIPTCVDQSTMQAVGDAMDGVRVFTSADVVSDDPDTVLYKAVMQTYAPDTPTDGFAITGYQGMLGLVRAVEGLEGEPTKESIISAVRSATDVPLPAAQGLTFTCNGTALPGLPSVCGNSALVATVEDGAMGAPTTIS